MKEIQQKFEHKTVFELLSLNPIMADMIVNIELVIIILIHVITNGGLCTIININYGALEITNGYICNITVGNETYYNVKSIDKLLFGLIKYECGKEVGEVMSHLKCMKCDMYCMYNDMMTECQHYWVPLIFGITLSTVVFLFFGIIFYYHGYTKIIQAEEKWLVKKTNKREKKINKVVRYLKENGLVSGDDVNFPPADIIEKEIDDTFKKDHDNGSDSIIGVINDPRFCPLNKPKLNRDMSVTTNNYPRLPNDSNEIHEATAPELTIGMRNNYNAVTIMLIALSALFNLGMACDQTLFLSSNGQICDSNSCKDMNTYSFKMNSDNLICFRTMDNKLVKFKIANAVKEYTFNALYYTSNFEVVSNHTYNCRGAGYCHDDLCRIDSKHPDFPNTTDLHIDSCESDGLSCDTICFHKYACTWYRLTLKKINELATVYKKVSSLWEFQLIVETDNIQSVYRFNTYNPSHDIYQHVIFSNTSLPITVQSIDTVTDMVDDFIVEYLGKIYITRAAEFNFPISGMVGDYQISLNHNTEKYDMLSIICIVSACKPYCRVRESGLKTMLSTDNIFKSKQYKKHGDYILKYDVPTRMNAQIMIGNLDFKNLYVEQPICEFNVISTYGCIGCNQLSKVYIQTMNVKHEGIIKIDSNCSLSKNYLSCHEQTDELEILKDEKYCRIFIPSMNKTLDFSITNRFMGDLSKYNPMIVSSNPIELAKSIISNPNFLEGFSISLYTYTGIGALITVLARVIPKLIIMKKVETETRK